MSSLTQIFIAYSRKDSELMEKLRTHLRPLERVRMAKIWYDGIIEAGRDWEKEIKTHLHTADIILLLISADFMDSDYCYDEEMMEALEKHKRNEARVIPIILRPCAWKFSPFAKLQVLPKDGKPVIEQEDYAFTDIVETVANICQKKSVAPKPNKSFLNLKNSFLSRIPKEEEDLPLFETTEMKETQAIADAILSGEFFSKKSNPNNENSFTDPRDGQIYKTVKLLDGRTWMAENLNFNTLLGCYYYNNDPANEIKYGRLYTRKSADVACPKGWKLPSANEWREMISAYGKGEWEGKFLKLSNEAAFPFLAEGGEAQFNANYGGSRTDLEKFNYLEKFGNYWGSGKNFSGYHFSIQFDKGLNKIFQDWKKEDYALSVRCIKDE